MKYVLNPKTGRKIIIYGITFEKLVNEGYIYFDAVNKLLKPPGTYNTIEEKKEWYYGINYGSYSETKESDVITNIFCIPTNEKKKSMWRTQLKVGVPSAFGSVWSACENSNCDFVIKYQKYKIDDVNPILTITKKTVEREIEMQKIFARNGYSVPVLDEWYCEDGAAFVMKKLSMTVKQLLLSFETNTYKWLIFTTILEIISKLHNDGFFHGDLHLDNIMVEKETLKTPVLLIKDIEYKEEIIYNESNYKFYLIDLGFAGRLTKSNFNKRVRSDYERLVKAFGFLYDAIPDEIFNQMKQILNTYVDKFK